MNNQNRARARFGLQIRGLSHEVPFSEFEYEYSKRHDTNSQTWLDKLEYRSRKAVGDTLTADFESTLDEEGLRPDPITTISSDGRANHGMAALVESIVADETCQDAREKRRALLPEAMIDLTDRQAIALWLEFGTDLSQREAAACMGVAQSVFHESIYGKDGVGGALRKLRQFFVAHPIAQP